MANKQSDPIQILANNIVNTMNSVATRRSDGAPFDKSFYVTILGVNRKFIDDVPGSDRSSIITKYSIPETFEDGDPNYYTVKINGAYYVVKQNANFMLYDKLMAYLPNGDWSRMYLDYQSGGKGDGATVVIYHTPYNVDPADEHEVNDGDYWIAVESAYSDKFKYFKQRIDGEWITYCSATNDLNINIARAIIVQESDIV